MKKLTVAIALGILAFQGLVGCSPGKTEVTSHLNENPEYLSAWGLFDMSDGGLELSDRVLPYDLNAPLFTDYAHKLRTIWVPPGSAAVDLNIGGSPDFPVGTVISKTFYYPRAEGADAAVLKAEDPSGRLNPVLDDLEQVRLMETRLLVRRGDGWDAVSYVWNDGQTDATLTKIGDAKALTLIDSQNEAVDFTYIVPDINQCAGCHAPNNTTREIQPLGVRARHINKAFEHPGATTNQISMLEDRGVLTASETGVPIPANADWTDTSLSLELRARSYLDVNCSHCHNPVGPADTSGLDLTMQAELGPALGVCKLPIAAGSGTGGRAFSIEPGEPDESILVYRLETTKPGAMMPELGRALQHAEGIALIRQWIAEMDGDCRA